MSKKNFPGHRVLGIDPDAICDPIHQGLRSRLRPEDGMMIGDYPPARGGTGHGWKTEVIKLAKTRLKNKKIDDNQFKQIEVWLELNKRSYPALPHHQDPRFVGVGDQWNEGFSWRKNAAKSLQECVDAILSPKEWDASWGDRLCWRGLSPSEPVELLIEDLIEQPSLVKRSADNLAGLVAPSIRHASIIKVIDPYTSLERWTPTFEKMLSHAQRDIVMEVHAEQGEKKACGWRGVTDSSRENWMSWAKKTAKTSRLAGLRMYFWLELQRKKDEIHDRFAIMGFGHNQGEERPFAGVSVGKGWDVPNPRDDVQTTFSLMNKCKGKRDGYEAIWDIYSENTNSFNRDKANDIAWSRSG